MQQIPPRNRPVLDGGVTLVSDLAQVITGLHALYAMDRESHSHNARAWTRIWEDHLGLSGQCDLKEVEIALLMALHAEIVICPGCSSSIISDSATCSYCGWTSPYDQEE